MIKKFLKKNYIIDLLFILVLSLTPLLWFEKGVIMAGHDNVFPLNPGVFLNGRLFGWFDVGFGRGQALIMGTVPIHFIDALSYLLGFSLQATQKLVYVFWFFMMGLSIYILANVLNKDRFFKLTAVVFYTYNFFLLNAWFIGERTKFSAYIAFPLILAVFFKVYRNDLKVLKGTVLISLILFIFNAGGLFGMSLYGGFYVALTVFIIFFSLLSIVRKEYAAVKRILLLTLFCTLSFFIVNAYYILPAYSQLSSRYTEGIEKFGGIYGLTEWAKIISANASYSNVMRLQGIADWNDNPEHPYSKFFLTNPILILISFLWPVLIFLSLYLAKKEKLKIIIYFMIVYLVGIVFTAGTHPPLGFIYESLLKYVPGWVAFRSPYFKFAPSIFLASSLLIAFFVINFQGKVKKIVFFTIISIALAYHFPYFTGNFFSWTKGFSSRNKIPEYVYEFGKWAEKDLGQDSRILLLPPLNPSWQYDVYEWGYLSFQTLPGLTTNKGLLINDDKISSQERLLLQNLYNAIDNADYNLTKRLSELFNIKYFLVRQDFETDITWMPVDKPHKPDFYTTILEKNFKLKPVRKFDKWIVYELNKNEISKFIMTDSLDSFSGSDKDIGIYFQFSKNNSEFVYSSSLKPNLQKDSFSYIVPECLNCRHELPPPIEFPKRQILPGSVFYRIVKYKEQEEIRGLAPREELYANLGFTLKRIGEMSGVVSQGRNLNSEILLDYLTTLQNLEKSFNSIQKYKYKFETAEDINYYLIPQKKYLYKMLGVNIYGKELETVDDIFKMISSIDNAVDPYLFKLNSLNNRFFLFKLNKQDLYEIFIKKEELASLFREDFIVNLIIDGKEGKEIKVDKDFHEKWLYFGKFNLSAGEHNILVSMPDLPNLLDNSSQKNNWFGSKFGNNCFGGNIKNFDNKKVYKLYFEVFNDFSERSYFYEVRKRNGKEEIQNILKLEKRFEKDISEQLIYMLGDEEDVSFYICSENIDWDIIQKRTKIKVTEVFHPNLVVKPQAGYSYSKVNLSYKRINSTKYIVEINNSEPGFMIFNAGYDNDWILSDFKSSHFRVNGYANGWYLDKVGRYQLTLEYRPQKYFYYGGVISLILVIAGLIYLIKTRNN